MTQQAALTLPHSWTFVAIDPETELRSLIAEVHPEMDRDATQQELRDFEARLYDRNIRVGLFITQTTTIVVRDLLTAMDFRSNSYDENSVGTTELLQAAGLRGSARGDEFVREIRAWLEAVAGSWHSSLPRAAIGFMVPEVVGNLAQAKLEVWENVLGPNDAH